MSVNPPDPFLTNAPDIALLVADTDETQAYVFESNKLPEIRGASLRLEKLNDQIGQLVTQQAGCQLIYAGGGSLLAQVLQSVAPQLVYEMEALYPQETNVATITADWRPLPPDSQNRFGEMVSWAGHWLRQRKESKTAPPFWETLPHQIRCRSCQKRPAVASYLTRLPDWPICHICYQKRTFENLYKTWVIRFTEALGTNPDWSQHYYQSSRHHVYDPHTVGEIAQACQSRDNFIGLVYLDGDGIGRLLEQMKQSSNYQRFSQELKTVTELAVFSTLATHLHPTRVIGSEARREIGRSHQVGKEIHIHPFEIITIGGDDVLLILPADAAIPIATHIGQTFGQEMTHFARQQLRLDRDVSMSAGVVIADDHTPIRVLADLAKQLLKEAKKLPGGGLDFHILKSADMLDRKIDNLREQYPYELEGGDKGKKVRLLARPYSYAQAKTVWDRLKELKRHSFPTSQMQLLAETLLDGRQSATLFYEYQRKRNVTNETYQSLHQVLTALTPPTPNDPLPWQAVTSGTYSHQTVLWDIAELYDFVPKEVL